MNPAIPPSAFRDRAKSRQGSERLLMFRMGRERFAAELRAIEEAIDWPEIQPLPEMRGALLGAFEHRGRMTALYTPARPLGHAVPESVAVALVARIGDRRIGLAVDDVDDVLELELDALRAPPELGEADGVLLGVVPHGAALVGIVDLEALVAACLFDREMEIA